MNISHRLFAKILAAELQTLAEKMTNTIYRAAKVCSYQSASADKLLKYLGKIYSLFHPSVYLMYETKFIRFYS